MPDAGILVGIDTENGGCHSGNQSKSQREDEEKALTGRANGLNDEWRNE